MTIPHVIVGVESKQGRGLQNAIPHQRETSILRPRFNFGQLPNDVSLSPKTSLRGSPAVLATFNRLTLLGRVDKMVSFVVMEERRLWRG